MAILEVNKETCTKCGNCAAVCPTGIIYFREGTYPRLMPGKSESCLRCGHCVTVCPAGSLSHVDIPVENCPEIDRRVRVNLLQAEQLIKARRSIRTFQEKEVAGEDIEKLIDTARYAPTGHNNQGVRWLVINGREKVRRLSAIGADWMRWVVSNNPQMAPMLEGPLKRMEAGVDAFLRDAPALVITYKENMTSDCIIALSYFDLAVNCLGLGCCWAGYLMIAAATFQPMKDALNLPQGCQIGGCLMVGYPRYRYRRIPVRKPPAITWR
jgi:nitroreductase/NAD-dependent dihydropyrimidine dehydrogenase PreA subunit